MAIGMTYEQYWYGDPLMARAFFKAHEIRRRLIDEEAWIQGGYFVKALDATVCNMFRKSNSEQVKYPDKPAMLTSDEMNREKTEEDEEQEALWAEAWMTQFVQAGKTWGKKK